MSATPSAQFRLTIRVRIDDGHGTLGELSGAIAAAGGMVGAVDLIEVDGNHSVRDIVVDASGK
ncbi:MAG TPA: NAD-dependent malic enzyme, partial [Solirubrobacteraceae bacterium]|nr:NAD-dependent malic enzyme [Solirubrobacteraceae bacterium]